MLVSGERKETFFGSSLREGKNDKSSCSKLLRGLEC